MQKQWIQRKQTRKENQPVDEKFDEKLYFGLTDKCSKQIRKELKTKHKKERDDIDESTFEFLNF